jgi:hypothetical protein
MTTLRTFTVQRAEGYAIDTRFFYEEANKNITRLEREEKGELVSFQAIPFYTPPGMGSIYDKYPRTYVVECVVLIRKKD